MNPLVRLKENRFIKGFKSIVLFLIIIASIVFVFFPVQPAGIIVNYITILLFVLSLPFAERETRIIGLLIFIIGAYLMHVSDASSSLWIEAMGKNSGLLVLLIAVPLLGIPLKSAGYVEVLDSLANNYMKKKCMMYWVPSLFSHILGFFMNIGAVPLTYDITARGKVAERASMLANAISRGTGTVFLWSPNTVAVALVLEYLDVPWPRYFYLGFSFAVLALLLGYLSEILTDRKKIDTLRKNFNLINQPAQPVDKLKLVQLITYISLFILFILLIEIKSTLSVISVIPVIALLMPAIWLFVLGYKKHIPGSYYNYFAEKSHKYDGEVVLFVAAGFFSSALIISGWSDVFCGYIIGFSGDSTTSIAFTILATIIITGLIGIHPMISVSTFAASLDITGLGLDPVHLALVLAAGWSLGSTISPIAGNVLVVANVTGKKPIQVTHGNLLYSLFVFMAVMAFIALRSQA